MQSSWFNQISPLIKSWIHGTWVRRGKKRHFSSILWLFLPNSRSFFSVNCKDRILFTRRFNSLPESTVSTLCVKMLLFVSWLPVSCLRISHPQCGLPDLALSLILFEIQAVHSGLSVLLCPVSPSSLCGTQNSGLSVSKPSFTLYLHGSVDSLLPASTHCSHQPSCPQGQHSAMLTRKSRISHWLCLCQAPVEAKAVSLVSWGHVCLAEF